MDDKSLDTLLAAWARTPVAPGDAGAAADAALAAAPAPRRWWPAAAGGAIAASVALALVAMPGARQAATAPATNAAPVQSANAGSADELDAYAYRMMFTETPEEEMTI